MTVNKTKKAAGTKGSSSTLLPIRTDEEKRKAIEIAAYYRWLGKGGNPGGEVDNWLEAEEEVMQNVFDRDPVP